jgi:hypothetical protein
MPGTGPSDMQQPWWGRQVNRAIDAFSGLPATAKYAITWVAVVATIAAISYWIMMTEPKPAAVDCEGKQMSRGDICEEYREPGHVLVDTKTYDEMWQDIRDGNILLGRIGLAIAAILIIVGTLHVIRTIRSARGPTS